MMKKERYLSDGFAPYSLFTRPNDASPIVFCMNEGPEYFRVRRLIEEGGGILEKARKFDSTSKRIRIHDRSMVALEKDTDIFCLSYIEDCVQEDNLLSNLSKYRLGKSLFTNYDPFDILLGELTWKDIQKDSGEIVSQLENLSSSRQRSQPHAGPRPYTTGEQIAILEYIIKHKKYKDLRDIHTWRAMIASGVCPNRSDTALRDHFKRQVLPKIHVKTFPMFKEEELHQILQGWKQKDEIYAPPSLSIKVVEKNSPKPRVNFAPLPKDVRKRSGEEETTRIEETLQEESDDEEEEESPSIKRRRVSRLASPSSPSYSLPSSLKASQIFSNEIPEAASQGCSQGTSSQRTECPSPLENIYDAFPSELKEFMEKDGGRKPQNEERLLLSSEEEEEEEAAAASHPLSHSNNQVHPGSQSLDCLSQGDFRPSIQSTQKDLLSSSADVPKKRQMKDYFNSKAKENHVRSNGDKESAANNSSKRDYNKSLENCLKTKVAKVSLIRLSSPELSKYEKEIRIPSSGGSVETPNQQGSQKKGTVGKQKKKRARGRPRKRTLYSAKNEAVPQVFTPLDRDTAHRTTVPVVPPPSEPPMSVVVEEEKEEEDRSAAAAVVESSSEEREPQRSSPKKQSNNATPIKNDSPFSEAEDKILRDLLEKGHVSGSDIKDLCKSRVCPGRSIHALKERLSVLKRSIKRREKKKERMDPSFFTSSHDMKIINWIVQRHCFGALSGKLIWKRMEMEKVLRHKSAEDLRERFMNHIIPNIASFNLSQEIKSKLMISLD
eukprot:TRINITY_DN4068_c0_g1_i1.p1 TRINITY_DN4068_c0_g1~~TRINITY_DN4068_c0_g1_i1.p1  ORF type:complete len:777 (-),score=275.09 TRINITY_DN4068_c0_g1_i1:182-2512(-)